MDNQKFCEQRFSDVSSIDDVVRKNTGMTTVEFLYPERNPFLKGLKEVCDFLLRFFKKHPESLVTVVGDYDADGVMASLIMRQAVLECTGKEPRIRIPKRKAEGYGLSVKIIDEIESGLVITVDNGIAAIDAIKAAKDKGLSVVVTDHHLPREDGNLPEADALLDPNAVEGSAFSGYCGAGLAYRIFLELCPNSRKVGQMTALAAIATVADVVDLLCDNRNIVVDGLSKMKQKQIDSGLRILLEKLYLAEPTAGDIGFKIGPTVNASGRLYDDGPMDVIKLLSQDATWLDQDYEEKRMEALSLADILIQRNEVRKAMVETAISLVQGSIQPDEIPVVVHQPGISEGVIGLIASQLSETYLSPALVFTDAEEDGVLKGSGRTFGTFNLKFLLDKCKDEFLGYGGHAAAAGMTVKADNYEAMKEALQKAIRELGYKKPEDETAKYDLEISVQEVPGMLEELDLYAPFGQGNPEPIFFIPDFKAEPIGDDLYQVMGKKRNVLKMQCSGVSALFFNKVDSWISMDKPLHLDLVGTLSWNHFKGVKYPQIEVIAFAPAKPDAKSNPLTQRLENCFEKEVANGR